MKRCPECRRDYFDDSLQYCLDDGSALLEGPGSSEAPTAMLPAHDMPSAKGTPRFLTVSRILMIALGIAVVGAAGYWLTNRVPSGKNGPDPQAYEKYVKAKVLATSENRADTEAAIALFEEAVHDDPQYALAWAALASAYSIKAFYFASGDERKRLNEDAQVAVERSLAIDPNIAEAHLARGLILWSHANRFPHELAIQSYKRAIALNPDLDEAHHQLGLIYLHLGLFDKARAEIARSLEINPSNMLARFRYGVIDLYRGKYEDAYSLFNSTPLEKNPSLHAFQLATALFKLGRTDEASDLIDKYLREYPNDEGGVGTSVKAMILASKGRTDEAEAAIKRADDIGRDFGHFHHAAYNIASAYALLKQPEKAVDYLQLAADDGFPCYPLFESDDVFKELHQNSRYISLLTKLKQQWDRFNSAV